MRVECSTHARITFSNSIVIAIVSWFANHKPLTNGSDIKVEGADGSDTSEPLTRYGGSSSLSANVSLQVDMHPDSRPVMQGIPPVLITSFHFCPLSHLVPGTKFVYGPYDQKSNHDYPSRVAWLP